MKSNHFGVLLCFFLAVPAWFLGRVYPIIGGPVFGPLDIGIPSHQPVSAVIQLDECFATLPKQGAHPD